MTQSVHCKDGEFQLETESNRDNSNKAYNLILLYSNLDLTVSCTLLQPKLTFVKLQLCPWLSKTSYGPNLKFEKILEKKYNISLLFFVSDYWCVSGAKIRCCIDGVSVLQLVIYAYIKMRISWTWGQMVSQQIKPIFYI